MEGQQMSALGMNAKRLVALDELALDSVAFATRCGTGYPLSGASRFRGSGHDIDVYAFEREEAPLVGESKARKNGAGFTTLEKWLGEYHLLILRRNHADPIIVFPWWIWARLLEPVRLAPHGKRNQSYKITVQRSAS
jgi:hypothetical protein